MTEKTYTAVIIREGDKKGPMVFKITDDLDRIEKLIGCDIVDITHRFIGDTMYRIIVDDEGLLKGRKPTAYGEEPPLVGTIIFTNFAEDGMNFRDLTVEEIETINQNLLLSPKTGDVVVGNVKFRPIKSLGIRMEVWDAAYENNYQKAEFWKLAYLIGRIDKTELKQQITVLAGGEFL